MKPDTRRYYLGLEVVNFLKLVISLSETCSELTGLGGKPNLEIRGMQGTTYYLLVTATWRDQHQMRIRIECDGGSQRCRWYHSSESRGLPFAPSYVAPLR